MSVLESFIIQYFSGSVMKYWVAADAVRSRMEQCEFANGLCSLLLWAREGNSASMHLWK